MDEVWKPINSMNYDSLTDMHSADHYNNSVYKVLCLFTSDC
jgi:hypothetical protein